MPRYKLSSDIYHICVRNLLSLVWRHLIRLIWLAGPLKWKFLRFGNKGLQVEEVKDLFKIDGR